MNEFDFEKSMGLPKLPDEVRAAVDEYAFSVTQAIIGEDPLQGQRALEELLTLPEDQMTAVVKALVSNPSRFVRLSTGAVAARILDKNQDPQAMLAQIEDDLWTLGEDPDDEIAGSVVAMAQDFIARAPEADQMLQRHTLMSEAGLLPVDE